MPEQAIKQAVEHVSSFWGEIFQALIFALVGLTIGIGQLLASRETLTWQIVVGRAISTAGVGMAAGAIVIWIPGVPLLGQIGLAAALASLGTSGLERMTQKFFNKE